LADTEDNKVFLDAATGASKVPSNRVKITW
jgi:hypothetical protein